MAIDDDTKLVASYYVGNRDAYAANLFVSDLAELVSLCAQLRAEKRDGDGAAWAGTVSLLGAADGRLEAARAALRLDRDPGPLLALAQLEAGEDTVERALVLHAALEE